MRLRIMLAALWRMRLRSMGGVWDQGGKAVVPADIAASRVEGEEVWILAMGSRVEGSMASMTFVFVFEDGWGEPLMKAWRSWKMAILRMVAQ